MLRSQLEGRASMKLDVSGRDPHPDVRPLARVEDRDEEEHYTRVAFLPDGRRVLTTSWSGFVSAWGTDDGRLAWKARPAGETRISDMALTRDGTRALVVGDAGLVAMIDTGNGAVLRRWQGAAPARRTAVALSADDAYFATGDVDGNIEVWSLAEAAPLAAWQGLAWPAIRVFFTPDGRFVYAADPAGIRLWSLSTGELVRELGDAARGGRVEARHWWLGSLAVPETSAYVIAGGYDGARVIDLANGEVLREFAGHPMGVISTTLDVGRGEVTTTARDFTVRVFDVETAELRRELWLPMPLLSVMVDAVPSPAGDRLALATNDLSFARMGSFPVLKTFAIGR